MTWARYRSSNRGTEAISDSTMLSERTSCSSKVMKASQRVPTASLKELGQHMALAGKMTRMAVSGAQADDGENPGRRYRSISTRPAVYALHCCVGPARQFIMEASSALAMDC